MWNHISTILCNFTSLDYSRVFFVSVTLNFQVFKHMVKPTPCTVVYGYVWYIVPFGKLTPEVVHPETNLAMEIWKCLKHGIVGCLFRAFEGNYSKIIWVLEKSLKNCSQVLILKIIVSRKVFKTFSLKRHNRIENWDMRWLIEINLQKMSNEWL